MTLRCMQRLYLQFYVAVLLVLAVFVGAAALPGSSPRTQTPQYLDVAAELTGALLPDADAPQAESQKALDALHRKLRFDLALYRRDGSHDRHGRPAAAALRSAARARRLAARPGRADLHPAAARRPLAGRARRCASGRARSCGSWAASRCSRSPSRSAPIPSCARLGRRLERLKAGVEQLGGGDLGARVKVEGRDEVAALAASFNRSAERIEELVAAHRLLLANCSHELRTPLARIGMAASLLGEQRRPEDARGAEARHRRARPADRGDPAGEPARGRAGRWSTTSRSTCWRSPPRKPRTTTSRSSGEPVTVAGDRALLRRLIRNLLENARRYARRRADRRSRSTRAGRPRRARGARPRARRSRGRARAHLRAVLSPGRRRARAAAAAGLALRWCARSPRRHGGDAVCLAAEGGGSRFRIDLPAA